MRSIRIQRLIACLLFAVSLPGGNAAAQQTPHRSSLYLSDSRAPETKRPAPEFISLQALVAEALERNPEIIVMRRNFDMMRARVPQAKALPEPMLSYGYMGNATPIPPSTFRKAILQAVARSASVRISIPISRWE
ncbi:MAG TPA: hypothetical protein VFY40_06845 [Blastocatellia bacterium]|nr:hypothetical protein [Blastocatellia bacterium]